MKIEIEDINLVPIQTKLKKIPTDPDVMLAVHNALARYVDPYVPMQSGMLSTVKQITPEYVEYTQPYAHYQYTGIVYGPNIPIVENGTITGWFSPPGKGTKHPTGRSINYSTEHHPLATHHWEQAMMRDKGKEFTKEVERIIKWWLKRG